MPKPGSPAIADLDSSPATRLTNIPLRFLICGSAADSRSTLLHHLLRGSKTAVDGQPNAATGPQGLPVETAYRSFETDRRRFVITRENDHQQHVLGLVADASTADLAVVLVDARKGLLPQTRRTATSSLCSGSAIWFSWSTRWISWTTTGNLRPHRH